MDQWQEISRTGMGRSPISSLAIDRHTESVWTGTSDGIVTSYDSPYLHKYTSYRSSPLRANAATAVAALAPLEAGILSLTDDGVALHSRRGLMIASNLDADMKSQLCMRAAGKASDHIYLGGIDTPLKAFKASSMRTVSMESANSSYTKLQAGGRYLCCGALNGSVDLRDPDSLALQHTLTAHSGYLADMDMQGYNLLTCGYTLRGGSYVLDPLLKMFDLRMPGQMIPYTFPSGPSFVRIHPRLPSYIFVASQSGQFNIINTADPTNVVHFQTLLEGQLCGVDVSYSGDSMMLWDAESTVSLWSLSAAPQIGELRRPLEMPDLEEDIRITDPETNLNAVDMPYYDEPLLSGQWPAIPFDTGLPPSPPIDSELLNLAKNVTGGVLVAPNMYEYKHNVSLKPTRIERRAAGAKFRSETAQVDRENKTYFEDADDKIMGKHTVPQYCRILDIKYSKFGVEDFDFEYFNKTAYAGLETDIENSHLNSALQLLYYSPALCNSAIEHSLSYCWTSPCLLCELGFLFQMLRDAKGHNCQATNFLGALSSIPEAAALGLLVRETPRKGHGYNSGLIAQDFVRFVLRCITKQDPQLPRDGVFSSDMSIVYQCNHCGYSTSHEVGMISLELPIPTNAVAETADVKTAGDGEALFASLVQNAFEKKRIETAYCQACRGLKANTVIDRVDRLPQLLYINSNPASPMQWKVWRTNGWPARYLSIGLHNGQCFVSATDPGRQLGALTYRLRGFICEVKDGGRSHTVTFVNMKEEDSLQWYVFNDFLVKQLPESEVLDFVGPWKIPVCLLYEQDSPMNQLRDSFDADVSMLYSEYNVSVRRDSGLLRHRTLEPEESPGPDMKVAIDAEFVSLRREESEVYSDSTRVMVKPAHLSLARVSVLRYSGEPFIDDYVETHEHIVDYLTEFSGIYKDDLNPEVSPHTLVPLKIAYKKLRLLVSLGCKFIGHGLAKDFRIINLIVPREQIIDTVELFYLKSRQRKLSLRFLAWYLLDQDIQQVTHDSIEDAYTALRLYEKYLELERAGTLTQTLHALYRDGRQYNYRPPTKNAGAGPEPPSVPGTPVR